MIYSFSVYVALTYIPVGDSADRVCDEERSERGIRVIRRDHYRFSLFGRVGVYSGISQWYRVGDAGALRAEPLATLHILRGQKKENGRPKP